MEFVDAHFNDECIEESYRERCNARESQIKKLYGKSYNIELHGEMIRQMIRSEMRCEHYERLIDRNDDQYETHKLLASERQHLRTLWEQCQTSLRSIRGDKHIIEHELPKKFEEFMAVMLEAEVDEVGDEEVVKKDGEEEKK